MAKKLVLIDGYSLIFRAFYGTKFLSTSDGRPTNALFGFVSMLFQLIERDKPECIVVALDPPGKTFRAEEFEDYKAHRTEAPHELIQQFPMSRELIDALGIPVIEIERYEADDVIGTLSLDAEKHGYETIIVTGDLDSLQLVDDHVKVMTTRQGVSDVVIYDTAAVHERYGFGPEFVPDYKALVGDTSDNIPGVPGIGAKTAAKLINQFGHVENMIQNIDQMDPKIRAKFEPFTEQIPASKRLATIVRDLPVSFEYKPFKMSPQQLEAAKALFQSLEFRSHLKKLPEVMKPYLPAQQMSLMESAPVVTRAEISMQQFSTLAELEKWAQNSTIGMFYATDSAFAANGKTAACIPVEVADAFFRKSPQQCAFHDVKAVHRRL